MIELTIHGSRTDNVCPPRADNSSRNCWIHGTDAMGHRAVLFVQPHQARQIVATLSAWLRSLEPAAETEPAGVPGTVLPQVVGE